MILSSAVRAFVCTQPVDMSKSIDGLSQIVAAAMGMNPLSGQVFVFIGRRRDHAKLLVWDRHGFCTSGWSAGASRTRHAWPATASPSSRVRPPAHES